MKTSTNLAILLCLLLSWVSTARSDEMKSEYSGSKEFQQMKELVGTWEGTHQTGEKSEKVAVTYDVTSGGSAIVETLFVDTPHEMVSIYYDEDGKLGMTHYCMLNNQPHMTLQKAEDNKLDFVFADGTNVKSAADPHMHALSISLIDQNNIVQEWKFYENGQEKDVTAIKLTRVQ